MKKEIKELKAELLKVFSKFEENECEAKTVLADEDEEGWYINEKGSLGLHKHGQKTSAYLVYDLTFYNDRTYLYSKLNGTWRKATESEVKEAFTNYFRSKGWVSGKTKFKSAAGGEFTYKEPLTFYDGNIVSDSSGCLFSKATITLATKIEDEKIMVDGKEVVFSTMGCYINDRWFDINDIEALLTLNPIFQKILEKLNEK